MDSDCMIAINSPYCNNVIRGAWRRYISIVPIVPRAFYNGNLMLIGNMIQPI